MTSTKVRYSETSSLKGSWDTVVLPLSSKWEKDPTFKEVSKLVGKGLTKVLKDHQFSGKSGQQVTFPAPEKFGADYLIAIGVGDSEISNRGAADFAARAVRAATKLQSKSPAFLLPQINAKAAPEMVQNIAMGSILGGYQFDRYKKQNKKRSVPTKIELLSTKQHKISAAIKKQLKTRVDRGVAIAEAASLARDFVNEPAVAMTPTRMSQEAKKIAKGSASLTVKVLSEKECQQLKMGMFLAVGRGSDEPSKLVHMVYKPKGKPKKKVALVGKGVTFDSGGYSLKPSASMLDMKVDMAGSAAVVSAMHAIAKTGCKHEVHAITALCENLVNGRAYKLGDVITAMDGTTVEINNTDAEGRLTLGDALTYVQTKVKPDEIFDFATLTGACMVALGPTTAALMTNKSSLGQAFLNASKSVGEKMWELPLIPELRRQLDSPIADMKNTGERWGGAITAGLFLKNFIKKTPWVHVDIAGPASANKTQGVIANGGTGFAVATIVEYLTRD